MTKQVIKFTKSGNSYWNNSGAYQEQLDRLTKLTPDSGAADTVHGELVRAANRLYYEYCNNGNCNAVDVEYYEEEYTCNSCGGSGMYDPTYGEEEGEECEDCDGNGVTCEEEQGEVTINEFYQAFIDFIGEHLVKKVHGNEVSNILDEVGRVIILGAEEYKENYFNDAKMSAYDRMTDYVIWYVLNTENSKLNNK